MQVEAEGQNVDMSFIIRRQEPIPCSKWQFYVTGDDNQTIIEVPIYQGESDFSWENRLIGNFSMAVAPRPAYEVERFTITFDHDKNGILNVTATENFEGKNESITINNDAKQMT